MTLHLLPADDSSQIGSGTATDPIRVLRDPEEFDQRCRWIDRLPAIQQVMLGPGVYLTLGQWAHPFGCHFTRSIRIVGDRATIRLSNSPATQTDPKGVKSAGVLGLGDTTRNNGPFHVSGLTIDPCAGEVAPDIYVTSGLWLCGNQGSIENVTVEPLRGSMAKGHETFGILTNNRSGGSWGTAPTRERDGGILIRDCTVYVAAGDDAYDSGIHIGHIEGPGLLQPTVVERCQVIGTGPKPARVAFAFGSRVVFRDCYACNVTYGGYNDTGHAADVMVYGMRVDRLRHAAWAIHRIAEQYPGWKRNLAVRDSSFRYDPGDGQWGGLVVWDKSQDASGDFADISIRNSRFYGPAVEPLQPFFAVAIDAPRVERIELEGCTLPASAQQHVTGRSPTLQFSRYGVPLGPYRPRVPSSNSLRGEVEMPRPEGER